MVSIRAIRLLSVFDGERVVSVSSMVGKGWTLWRTRCALGRYRLRRATRTLVGRRVCRVSVLVSSGFGTVSGGGGGGGGGGPPFTATVVWALVECRPQRFIKETGLVRPLLNPAGGGGRTTVRGCISAAAAAAAAGSMGCVGWPFGTFAGESASVTWWWRRRRLTNGCQGSRPFLDGGTRRTGNLLELGKARKRPGVVALAAADQRETRLSAQSRDAPVIDFSQAPPLTGPMP